MIFIGPAKADGVDGSCSICVTMRHSAGVIIWSSLGLVDAFQMKKERVFQAENEEPVRCGIQGSDGCAGAGRAQC